MPCNTSPKVNLKKSVNRFNSMRIQSCNTGTTWVNTLMYDSLRGKAVFSLLHTVKVRTYSKGKHPVNNNLTGRNSQKSEYSSPFSRGYSYQS